MDVSRDLSPHHLTLVIDWIGDGDSDKLAGNRSISRTKRD